MMILLYPKAVIHDLWLTPSSLDFSFNNLRHPPTLPSQARLKILYLVQNKINQVEAGQLDWCSSTLTSIELGGNRLRRIENLEVLTRLEELWLGKNKIRTLEVGVASSCGGRESGILSLDQL